MKKFWAIVAIAAGLFGVGLIINGCTHNDYVQPPMAAPVPAAVVAQAPGAAPVVGYAPPPVIVQAAPTHDGFFTGMLMGHLMSGGGGYHAPVQHNTTIVQQSVTRNTIVRPAVAAPRANTYVYRPTVRSSGSSKSVYGSFRRR